MKKKLYTLAVAMVAGLTVANAQQDMMLTQEMFSRINKNPAGTGNAGTIDAFLHGRYQWAGVDNSPKSFVLNVVDYEEKIKSGIGLSVGYDNFGVGHSNTNPKLCYSYQLDLNSKTVLSLGLAAGANFGYFNFAENTIEENIQYEEQLFEKDKDTKITPDFDLGFELSQLYWTLGASVTHLTNNDGETQVAPRHFYVYGTGLIPVNAKFDLAPTVAYMHRNKTDVMEVGTMVFYNRLMWGGVAWRPDIHNGCNPSTLALTLGLEWKKFRFGYSFDMGLGSENQLPSNTHEIILSASFDKKKK
ncbi:MAG: PorP/SprF family type IX secretion system membrane protein [Paludibacteraceae bacterium]|nr:PorP/SprF family type IX secretion system membrane protein [Paludibacteraceae bacterium]